jgi:YidC/Oxa1 family membrane protein insertase
MAGCIPMLLQLPILLALFRFFPASIELRQEAFLWADDLSSYDSILDLPFTIPFYGDHVSLFTILMTVSTILYTRMNNQMMASTSQMPGMKTMMYFMPVMLMGIFNNFASGLSYYYFLANIITFGQMYLFRLFVDEDALHRKIEENKKKPVKKSKWAERMEALAKQQETQKKRKK